jgi:hypothetical protein
MYRYSKRDKVKCINNMQICNHRNVRWIKLVIELVKGRFTFKAASKLNIAYIQLVIINQYLVGDYIIVQII